ncbi:hypothetical protein Z043_104417 [Scleropages formosus]|uniref:DH domain-containing protein n=1 Tax=Scleropages formosus TaxID=113540 RepID=A0A0P7Z6D3_SCLFO|nr:hypothetical protein Z043_104417 [Scleropages formosus]
MRSVETVCTLYQTFQGSSDASMESRKDSGGSDPGSGTPRPCPRHMPAAERLRKVIQELVDTEKSYVKDLTCLFEIYLKPLQNETFLTVDEVAWDERDWKVWGKMESLFGSLPEMLDFQKIFLQTLEERIASSPDFSTLETPVEFKVGRLPRDPRFIDSAELGCRWRLCLASREINAAAPDEEESWRGPTGTRCATAVRGLLGTRTSCAAMIRGAVTHRFLSLAPSVQKLLFSLGAPFLYYADHFKLYSGFCANHIKVQKVLERVTRGESRHRHADSG